MQHHTDPRLVKAYIDGWKAGLKGELLSLPCVNEYCREYLQGRTDALKYKNTLPDPK